MSTDSTITDVEIALKALRAVALDEKEGGSARAAAARSLLEFHGAIGRLQTSTAASKPDSELSMAEMKDRLATLRKSREGRD